jgi:uncharacterized protein (TIGR02145 family)
MKKIILFLIMLFIAQPAFSQKIVLHKNTGGDQTYYLSSVDSVTFLPFACGDEIIYEGKTYGTVLIGTQCWMKENLDVGTMIQGPSQPAGKQTNNQIIEKYCYNNDTSNCAIYGGLYEWNEAMQYVTTPGARGICPEGWHIPFSTEFQTLITTVGGDGNALLASRTNSSGFSLLLSGYVHSAFEALENHSFNWSSNSSGSNATYMYVYGIPSSPTVGFFSNWKWYGLSVRCLKN